MKGIKPVDTMPVSVDSGDFGVWDCDGEDWVFWDD